MLVWKGEVVLLTEKLVPAKFLIISYRLLQISKIADFMMAVAKD